MQASVRHCDLGRGVAMRAQDIAAAAMEQVGSSATSEREARAQLDAPRIKCGSEAERLTGSVAVVAA